jgi:hypothetical protein
MRTWKLALSFGLVALWLVAGMQGLLTRAAESAPNTYGLTLSRDRILYKPDEPIRLTLRLFNRTSQEITLHFKDAQRFDFILLGSDSKEVFRWSKDRVFAQVLGTETLGPRRPELVFSAEIRGPQEPGRYTVQGLVVASDLPLAGSLTLEIRP